MGMKNCPFQVVKGEVLTLTATAHPSRIFDKWAGGPCDNQPSTCQVLPLTMPLMIQAKFKAD
jgi:hypothetical protein